MEKTNVMELLETRRTYRRFDESKKIPDEVVEKMQYATRIASSAMNRQPLRYIYVRDVETVNAIFDITGWGGALPNGLGRPKVGERPTMFTAVLAARDLVTKFTDFDAGLAVSNMTLAAWECGVGSCILGSVNVEKLREILAIPAELDVITAVGFGYPTHTSTIVDSDGSDLRYYLDENKNYLVPKREIKDTVTNI